MRSSCLLYCRDIFRPRFSSIITILLLFVFIPTTEAKQKYTIIYISKEGNESKDDFPRKLEVLKVMRGSNNSCYRTMIFAPEDKKLAASFHNFIVRNKGSLYSKTNSDDIVLVNGYRYFYNTVHSSESFHLDTQAIVSDNYRPIIISMVSENIKGWNQLSEEQYETYKKILLRNPEVPTYYTLPDISAEYNFIKVSCLDDLKPVFIEFLKSYGFSMLNLRKTNDSFLERSDSNKTSNFPRYRVTGKAKEEIPSRIRSITLDLERLANAKELKKYKCKPCADRSIDRITITGHGVVGNIIYLAIHLSLFGFDWERGSSGCFCPDKASRSDSVRRLILIDNKGDKTSKDINVTEWITFRARIVEWAGEF